MTAKDWPKVAELSALLVAKKTVKKSMPATSETAVCEFTRKSPFHISLGMKSAEAHEELASRNLAERHEMLLKYALFSKRCEKSRCCPPKPKVTGSTPCRG